MNCPIGYNEESPTNNTYIKKQTILEGVTSTLPLQGCIGTNTHHGGNMKPLTGDRQTEKKSVVQKIQHVYWQMPINDINNDKQPATIKVAV